MSQNKDFILFYSSQKSVPCDNFMRELSKNKELYNTFIKIDILNKNVELPKSVKSVPTIIIRGQNLYTGNEAYNWLTTIGSRLKSQSQSQSPVQPQQQPQQSNSPSQQQGPIPKQDMGGISDFDPTWSSSGLSDGFSYLNDNPQALDKNFSFINGNRGNDSKINTPMNTNNADEKDDKVKAAEMAMERLKKQRELDIAPPINRV